MIHIRYPSCTISTAIWLMEKKLEQLECLHSEIPPFMITHTGDSHQKYPTSKKDKVKVTNLKKLPKIQIFKYC